MADEQKICFIMCANNEQYRKEAIYYIRKLAVPKGYCVEYQVIEGASGMASGYNLAMSKSNAKYKVYLHQDVMIIEPHFIEKLLHIFSNPKIGMIGMIGTCELPENGVMWYAPCIGKVYMTDAQSTYRNEPGKIEGEWQQVEMIDGLLMATQYDLPWREDIFDGWDFYDASQCQEFIRKGYKVVVPDMEVPWCIHDCGNTNLQNYWIERKKFIREYKETAVRDRYIN